MRHRHLTHLLLLGGLALLVGLLVHYDLPEIVTAFTAAGWGVAVVAAFHLVPLVLDAIAWQVLVRPPDRLSLGAATRLRWIAESVNGLLPTASVGGEFARARLAGLAGVQPAVAAASVIVDVTLGLITQSAFVLVGLMLLARFSDADPGLLLSLALGLGGFSLVLGVLLLLQNRGVFSFLTGRIARFSGAQRWPKLTAGGADLDRAVATIYRQRRVLLVSSLWRMAGWVVGAGEMWLALRFLGHPIDVGDAILVESLIQALRTAYFLVPAGVGVQEASFLLIAGAIGVPPPVAIALSFIKRAREILLGIPGILAWHAAEAAHLRRSPAAPQSRPGATDECGRPKDDGQNPDPQAAHRSGAPGRRG